MWMKAAERKILENERGQEVAGEGARQGEGKVREVKDKEQGTSAVLSLSQRLANQDTFLYKYSRLCYVGHTSPSPPSIPCLLPLAFLPSVHPSPPRPACLSDSWWTEAVGCSEEIPGNRLERGPKLVFGKVFINFCLKTNAPELLFFCSVCLFQQWSTVARLQELFLFLKFCWVTVEALTRPKMYPFR